MIKKERWPRNYSGPDDNYREVDIPLSTEHSCVTRVVEVFDEPEVFAIVMEYAPGGELPILSRRSRLPRELWKLKSW